MQRKEINIQTGEETIIDLTAEEIAAKEAREVEVQAEQNHYTTKRREAYPPIGDQLDMQYWDKINATSIWSDLITKIKSDNPKE